MKQAAVVVGSLNGGGGAERTSVEIIRLLMRMGYRVDLVELEKADRTRMMHLYDIDLSSLVSREVPVIPCRVLPTIYSRFVHWLTRDLMTVPFLKRRYDLTLTTMPLTPIGFSDIVYFPDLGILPFELFAEYDKYTTSRFMAAYSLPYKWLMQYLSNAFRSLDYRPIAVANSVYARQILAKELNLVSHVIYPFVRDEAFKPASENGERKNIVLLISRFERAKRLEMAIEIAKRSGSNARFVLLGSAYGDDRTSYVRELRTKAEEAGVGSRVSFIVNASSNEKARWLCAAKILLHTRLFEPFGISVVEGMAAGLVPVVHASGGPWIDIIDHGKYGFGFQTVDEAASIVERVLTDNTLCDRSRGNAVERATIFSRRRFDERFAHVVAAVSRSKKK